MENQNVGAQIKAAHNAQRGAPYVPPVNRRFLNMIKEIGKVKCNVEDFLDDRVPAINTQNFDQQLLKDTPQGIRSDKDMEGAWMFAQFILNRASVPAMKPYELVVAYQAMNECGLKMQKLARIKQQIKMAKRDKEAQSLIDELKEEYAQVEKSIGRVRGWSRMQRDAITQVVLIIGFIKEYVSVRAVKIENAEEAPVFIPCRERGELHQERDISKEDTFFDTAEKILYVGKGVRTFFANPIDAISENKETGTTHFMPILKKVFSRDIRIGSDRDDRIVVQIPDDFKIGYLETEPIAIGVLTKMIEDSKAPTPILTKEDVAKADAADEVVTGEVVE